MSSVASLLSGTPASISRAEGGWRITAQGTLDSNGVVACPSCLPSSTVYCLFVQGAPGAVNALVLTPAAGSFTVAGLVNGASDYVYLVLN
jgi:hypothetical protein